MKTHPMLHREAVLQQTLCVAVASTRNIRLQVYMAYALQPLISQRNSLTMYGMRELRIEIGYLKT